MNTREVGAKRTGNGADDSRRPISVGFCSTGRRHAASRKTWRNDVLEDDSTDLVSETSAPKKSLTHRDWREQEIGAGGSGK